MMELSFKNKLARYIDAGFPIIYLNTYEEEKADRIISQVSLGREIYEWNETNGYIDVKSKESMMEDCTLEMMLDQLRLQELLEGKMIILKDTVPYLDNPRIVSKIKGLARMINQGVDATIIIVANTVVIPVDLEKFITILEMDYLSREEIKEIILDFIEAQQCNDVPMSLIEEMSKALMGFTEFEINNLLALSYSDGGKLTKTDLEVILDQKQQMIRKAGILEMISSGRTETKMDDIGGLENLKQWFSRKEKIFKNMEWAKTYGVDMPKGVLITGVPGCGKSMSAKAAATLFGMPLLRMDMGRLMGKYVGESERNMRKALALAEAIAPCVLWIDEMEKAFAGINGNGGGAEVTTRLFGNFLTWMQEKESSVFVVATANDVTKLPPELLRKGRFDEIFYVGLPKKQERERIFDIHIRKRRSVDLVHIDISELASMTEGYSGADIEGVVKDAVEAVFSDSDGREGLHTQDIIRAIRDTHPLSEIMAEDLKKMQKEYESRKFKNASR